MLRWDTLGVRRQHYTTVMMHEIPNKEAPGYITEALRILIRDGTAYHLTSSSHNLVGLQKPNAEYLKKSFVIVKPNYGILSLSKA